MINRHVYTAVSYSHLAKTLLDSVSYYKKMNPLHPFIILTPHPILGMRLKKWLIEQLGGCISGHFYTIAELADIVRISNDKTTRQVLHPCLKQILWQHFAEQTISTTSYWKNSLGLPGFAPAVQNLFAELKTSGITAQQFQTIAETLAWPKMKELSDLFTHYQQQLGSQGIYDDQEQTIRATGLLEEQHPWQDYPLWLFGFWKWSWGERKFLEKWFQHQTSYVFLPVPTNPYLASNTVHIQLQWLKGMDFQEVLLDDDMLVTSDPHSMRDGLFAKRLFYENISDRLGHITGDEVAIEICNPPDIYQEVEHIAQIILHQVSQGISFSQIAVLVSPTSIYHNYLQSIFQRLKIPYYNPHSSCNNTPQSMFILEILELTKTQGKAEVLQNVWHSMSLNLASILPYAVTRWAFDWDALSLELGMPKNWEIWQQKLDKHIILLQESSQETTEQKQTIAMARALLDFVRFWQRACLELSSNQNYQTLRKNLAMLIEQVSHPSPILRILLSHLNILDMLDRWQIFLSLDKAISTIQLMVDHTPLPENITWYQGVLLGDLSDVYGLPLDVVIVPGMMEKEMPQMNRQEPLLLEQDRIAISKLLEPLHLSLSSAKEQICEQKLFYYMALINARQIFLSWPKREAMSGQERLPCAFLLETASAIEGGIINFSNLPYSHIFQTQEAILPWNRSPQNTFSDRDYALALSRYALSGDHQAWKLLTTYYPLLESAYHHLQERWQSSQWNCYDGMLKKTQAYSPVRSQPIGVKMMEDYALCPLRFFFQHILQCSSPQQKKLVPMPGRTEQRNILLKTLQRFFEFHKAAHVSQRHQISQFLHTAAEINTGPRNSPIEQMLWEITRDTVTEYLEYYLKTSDQAYTTAPVYFNLSFQRSKDKPVSLTLSDGRKILWKGELDQINLIQERYSQSIRYDLSMKSKAKKKYTLLEGGKQLQLAIDLLALRQLLSDQIPQQSILRILHPASSPDDIYFSEKDWADLSSKLLNICTLITQSIELGRFFPIPDVWKCKYCPYRVICGPLAPTLFALKQNDSCMNLYETLQNVK